MSNNIQSNDNGTATYKIREMVALFDDSNTLERAIETLQESGFNRADISLLATEETVDKKLGHHFKSIGELEDDGRVPQKAFVSKSDVARPTKSICIKIRCCRG